MEGFNKKTEKDVVQKDLTFWSKIPILVPKRSLVPDEQTSPPQSILSIIDEDRDKVRYNRWLSEVKPSFRP